MNIKSNIIIRTSFTALHRWSGCPIEAVSFLKNTHRHVFFAEFKFKVLHNDRDIEFINMKAELNTYILQKYSMQDLGETSCEMICADFLKEYAAKGMRHASIFEDNENGAESYIERN